jgi:hypothetical protein
MSSGCAGVAGFYCHTPNDRCMNDSDCPTNDCGYDSAVGYWSCQSIALCPGG